MKRLAGACLLAVSVSVLAVAQAQAADAASPAADAGTPVLGSHGLLLQLETFLKQREVDSTTLTADAMVGAMIDWVRFAPASHASDTLIYQYGGWSEGCATGFKLSLLRKVSRTDRGAEDFAETAGITLIFEPSANTDLAPFRLVSSDVKSIDDFMAAIEGSPAFRKLATVRPMSVVVESGGMR